MSSIQRILSNHRNALVGATLTPSSVQAIADAVIPIERDNGGNARASLSGSFDDVEQALFEVEIVDTTIDSGHELVSEPEFIGVGSGTISGISAIGAAQKFTVTLGDLGQVLTAAGTELESVSLVARTPGAAGNAIHLSIDQSALVFTPTTYSTLVDLAVGDGDVERPLSGAQWDWDTKIIGADEQIPTSAHRITFGGDQTQIYTEYKRFRDGGWQYHLEPELQRAVPKGTAVNFVTGGRVVTVTDGTTPEEYTDIITLYDLCNALRSTSQLVTVVGVVANDRSPGGMAVRELKTRTDARVNGTSGEGSQFAKGFEDTTVGSNTYTELIEARCWANSRAGSDVAGLGRELWELRGSVSGLLKANLITGELFTEAAGRFALRIPTRLPDGYGVQRGKFTVRSIDLVARAEGEGVPDVRPVALSLGPNAVDQELTLVYRKRPELACSSGNLPVPNLNTECLLGPDAGGGGSMSYSADNVTRLTNFYKAIADLIRTNSRYHNVAIGPDQDLFISNPAPNSTFTPEAINTLAGKFETALAALDVLPAGAPRTAGEDAWDASVAEFQLDMWEAMGAGPAQPTMATADEALAAGQTVHVYRDNDSEWRVRLNLGSTCPATHFVLAAVIAGAQASCYRRGFNDQLTGLVEGSTYGPDTASPGDWVTPQVVGTGMTGIAVSATTLRVVPEYAQFSALTVLSDRYKARLNQVLMTAGISPLGKADPAASGDGCGVDWQTPYYWDVQGSVGGGYAPAFTNHPYYSSKFNETGKRTNATLEFAFQINVNTDCEDELKVGDTIRLAIGDAGWPATYQIGDRQYLELIAASDLYLAGGKDGDNTQTWFVDSAVDGPRTPYALVTSAPAAYSAGGLEFLITPGFIPHALGDQYQFTVEGGHFRWRKNGGAWSAAAPIDIGPTALSDGLALTFAPGAAPAFVTGDSWAFRALQPNAVSNILSPGFLRWAWDGADAVLDIDLLSVKAVDALAIAYHTLPDGATVLVQGGTVFGTWPESQALTLNRPVMAALLTDALGIPTPWNVRYLRLTVAAATGGAIGWFNACVASRFAFGAAVTGRRDYTMARSSSGGRNAAAKYLGRAWSGKWDWQTGALAEADWQELVDIFDHAKTHNDLPMILLPQWSRPSEAWLCRLIADQVELPEFFDMQPQAGQVRSFGAALVFDGVPVS